MRTIAAIILIAAFAACGGDDESGMSEQACRLIEDNGATPFQIFNEMDTDAFGNGEEFAGHLHDWIQADCPTVLDDPMWQGYFADNNVD